MKLITLLACASHASASLISTPCGMRPSECVREAPHLSHITFAPSTSPHDFIVQHSNNTLEYVTVPQTCHEFFAAAAAAAATTTTAAQHLGNIPNGWIESAGVYQMDPDNQIHSFDAKWTVPPKPTKPQKPETLYYFIGLEDRTQGKLTTIHQPVLTWGDQTEGGLYDDEWHLWSWTCCPKNLTWHSPDIAGFQPGDEIYGDITKISSATWKINGGFKSANGTWHNTTLTSEVGSYNYNYADVTLEVYNLTSCDQMVHGNVEFSDLHLTTEDGKDWVPSMWYPTGFPSNCKTTLEINKANHSMIIRSE